MPQMTAQGRWGAINISLYLTLADMKGDETLHPCSNANMAFLTGTVAYDKTPSGIYFWNPTSVQADNDSTIIKVTSITTGRWVQVPQ